MKDRNLRLKLNKHIELFWQGRKRHADIENISTSGAFVRTDIPVQVGDYMAVYLQNPAGPGTLEMGGEVIRIKPSRWGIPAFALQFLKIPEELRVFLRHISVKHNATIEA